MNIDPSSATGDGAIHWILSSALSILAAERTWMHFRSKLGYGRRNNNTFADRPEEYWLKMQQTMKDSITEPLGKILDKQTDILEKQIEGNAQIVQQLVRIDERTKLR